MRPVLPKYDPFEDPLLVRGLDPATRLTVNVLAYKAKLRWEKFKSFANNAVLGTAAGAVAVFSILHWTIPCLLVLALFLPIRFSIRALGRVFLVERALQEIRAYGNKYRR